MARCASTRREFLQASVLGLFALADAGACRAVPERSHAPPANLFILHTDQQNAWTVGASVDSTPLKTPHLDRLAREGVRFENSLVCHALCSPSRASLLTGRHPGSHGVFKNNLPLPEREVTLAEVLAEAGYETGYAGKWHLDGTAKPGWGGEGKAHGFRDRRFLFNRGHWKIVREEKGKKPYLSYKEIGDEHTYTTDWLVEKTLDFLRRPRRRPFFFMLSIPDPHPPYTVRAPFDTAFDPGDMILPPTVNEREGRPVRDAKAFARFERNLRKHWARYLGEVQCIDHNVGRILDFLDSSGLAENTLVVFTSDHGDYLGEHGLMGKNRLYETAYRVPLLLRWPGRIPAGRRLKRLFSNVDLAPTLLSLMGMKVPAAMEGRDGSPLVLGRPCTWKEEVFLYHSSRDFAGIFTPGYELVLCRKTEGLHGLPGRMLYDRREDPFQRRNLAGDPALRGVIRTLSHRILDHHRKLGTAELAWLPSRV